MSSDGAREKGWFQIPGVRPHGDRSIAEQLLGLDRALAEVNNAHAAGTPLSVLDLGCAEGPIALEFAKAGASRVVGIELLEGHLRVARKLCQGYLQITFHQAHIRDWIAAHPDPEQYDVVLALGIIHKLEDPNVPMRWAARAARSLLCFRAPAKKEPSGADYIIRAKHSKNTCNVQQIMRDQGFNDEGIFPGVRGEAVQYFRRKPAA